MLIAKGTEGQLELESETIRVVWTRALTHTGCSEIKVSLIDKVTWKEPGLWWGAVTFYPGLETLTFRGKTRDEFRAVYEAVTKMIDDARQFGAYCSNVLRPGFAVSLTIPETPGVEVRRNLRLGEIRREFDSQTAGAIQGAMHHELGLHGSFTSVRLGKFGIGLGQFGLSGMTSVDLKTSATTRSDFLNDGFVAVFDEPTQTGVPETLRVIVPSEEACRERITGYVNFMYEQMGLSRFGHSHDQLIAAAAKSVTSDISYVSDRLSAVLRTSADKTPVFNVVGVMSGQHKHMMLGGAIQMPGDDRWLQLFPVGLLRILSMPLGDGGMPEKPALR